VREGAVLFIGDGLKRFGRKSWPISDGLRLLRVFDLSSLDMVILGIQGVWVIFEVVVEFSEEDIYCC
jgi:hypothetical protein